MVTLVEAEGKKKLDPFSSFYSKSPCFFPPCRGLQIFPYLSSPRVEVDLNEKGVGKELANTSPFSNISVSLGCFLFK